MTFRLLADGVVLLHVAYILFVLFGAVLVRGRPAVLWAHLVAVAWGVYVAAMARVCPLTPLEVALRERAGQAGYHGGFIEHYVLPALYPGGLTRGILAAEAGFVVAVNVALYAWVWRARRRQRPTAR
jgi:hypothetical protein